MGNPMVNWALIVFRSICRFNSLCVGCFADFYNKWHNQSVTLITDLMAFHGICHHHVNQSDLVRRKNIWFWLCYRRQFAQKHTKCWKINAKINNWHLVVHTRHLSIYRWRQSRMYFCVRRDVHCILFHSNHKLNKHRNELKHVIIKINKKKCVKKQPNRRFFCCVSFTSIENTE